MWCSLVMVRNFFYPQIPKQRHHRPIPLLIHCRWMHIIWSSSHIEPMLAKNLIQLGVLDNHGWLGYSLVTVLVNYWVVLERLWWSWEVPKNMVKFWICTKFLQDKQSCNILWYNHYVVVVVTLYSQYTWPCLVIVLEWSAWSQGEVLSGN